MIKKKSTEKERRVRMPCPNVPPISVRTLDTIDSTNAEAKRNAATDHGVVLYVSRAQTNGRGRLGRHFHSPADTGLYMTLSFPLPADRPLSTSVHVTALAAVAAASAIENLTDTPVQIKWVNDLYRNGKKMAGILTEAVTVPDLPIRILVGVGVNLTTTSFPADLRAPATALFDNEQAANIPADFADVLAKEISRRLLCAVESGNLPDGTPCLDFYRQRLLYVGERVICSRGEEAFEGVVLGVDEGYGLVVETPAGVQTLMSGEISVRGADTPLQ